MTTDDLLLFLETEQGVSILIFSYTTCPFSIKFFELNKKLSIIRALRETKHAKEILESQSRIIIVHLQTHGLWNYRESTAVINNSSVLYWNAASNTRKR